MRNKYIVKIYISIKLALIFMSAYANSASAQLTDQTSTPSALASDNAVIERLQFQRVPQANIYDPDFAPLVFRYSESKESLSLMRQQKNADRAFAKDNYAYALRSYMRLAPYGEKNAQLRIGFIHLQGLGEVVQDVPRGMAWLELAREIPIANPEIAEEIDAIWEQLDQNQRQQAQDWLDKLAPMYSNMALLTSLDHYYERYFLNRGGTNLKSAGDRTSAIGYLLLDSQGTIGHLSVDGSDLPGIPNEEFDMRSELQFVSRMLEESAGTSELGELQLLDDNNDDSSDTTLDERIVDDDE